MKDHGADGIIGDGTLDQRRAQREIRRWVEAVMNKVEKCCGQSESWRPRWDNRRRGRGGGVALWMPRWLRLRCGAKGGRCAPSETL